jgi:phosphopantetheinyl transferase (holo-ACP synthase)
MDLKKLEAEIQNRLHNFFGDSAFRILISEEFGPQAGLNTKYPENYREKISRAIQARSWPLPESGHVSISHTAGAGALFFHPKYMVGVDLEKAERVQEKIVARVSSPEEIARVQNSSHLWVAKEASYKACRHHNQPQTISGIQISLFDTKNNTFAFKLLDSAAESLGEGFVHEHFGHVLALSWIK